MEADVIETLIELRRDYGLTPGHIREVGQPLMDTLGTTDADLVHRIVADAIGRMGRVRHALVLRASYGLDEQDAVTSLATRQNKIAKSLRISVDTVKRDERRAINELHHLIFPAGSAASRADDQVGQYMNAIEYIDFDAISGEGRFSINASNQYHSGQRLHIEGTPAIDEWRDDHFLSATSEVRRQSTTLLSILSGWSVDSLTAARPKFSYKSISQRFDSAQDIAQPSWTHFSALLHLRRWQFNRSIDDDFLDFYVSPSASDPWGDYTEEVYDKRFATRLSEMQSQIQLPVTAIAQEILQDPSVRLKFSGNVKWEKENTPHTGDDSYHFRLVVIGA